MSFFKGLNSRLADAINNDWIKRIQTAGGSAPSAPILSANGNFYDSILRGGILAKIRGVNTYAPGSLIVAATPLLKNSGPNTWSLTNFVSGDLTTNGLKGNGSNKFIDLGIFPTAMLPGGSDNCGLSIYYHAVQTATNMIDCGCFDTTAASTILMYANSFGNKTSGSCWKGDGSDSPQVASPGNGFYSFSRTSSTLNTLYFGNSTIPFASIGNSTVTRGASSIVTDKEFVLFAVKAGTGTIFDFSDARQAMFIWHDGLSLAETKILFDACQALRTAYGGGFV
jgi:hypothetical protein